MYRNIWGGIWLFGLIFNAFFSFSQIRLISAGNNKPVKDAFIHYTGFNREAFTGISDESGNSELPSFRVYYIQVIASG